MPIRLYERKDSRFWYCEFTTSDGNVHRRSTDVERGPGSEPRARKAAKAIQQRIEDDLDVVPSVSLEFAIGHFLEGSGKLLRANTLRLYTGKLANALASFPDARLADLTPAWVKTYVQTRRRAGASGISIRKEWVALSSVTNHAIAHNDVLVGAPEVNPWLQVKKTAQMRLEDSEVKERGLTKIELARLYEVVKAHPDPFWRDFFEITVEGGMRLEEVLGMRWERVDLVDGFINLDTSTKTAKTRDVPIMPVMEEAFARLAARRDPRAPDAGFVFVNPETGRRYRSIWRGWHAIRLEARLPSCRIHDLRHTFSKLSGDADFQESDRMQHQGHTQEATQRRYRGASARLKEALTGRTPLATIANRPIPSRTAERTTSAQERKLGRPKRSGKY